MANEDPQAEPRAAVEVPAAPRSAARGGRKGALYPKERLIGEAEAFLGEPSHVVAGALVDLPDDEAISVGDAEARVREFLKRTVGGEGGA